MPGEKEDIRSDMERDPRVCIRTFRRLAESICAGAERPGPQYRKAHALAPLRPDPSIAEAISSDEDDSELWHL